MTATGTRRAIDDPAVLARIAAIVRRAQARKRAAERAASDGRRA